MTVIVSGSPGFYIVFAVPYASVSLSITVDLLIVQDYLFTHLIFQYDNFRIVKLILMINKAKS